MPMFKVHRPEWNDEQFDEAELLVSGVEYATLMTAGTQIQLETRIAAALHNILGIYGISPEIREMKIKKVFAMDYRGIGKSAIAEFKQFVEEANEQTFADLLKR